MRLSALIPQPFQELVTNYYQLKEQLKTEDPASKGVQITATKVAVCATHCFESVIMCGLLIGAATLQLPSLLTCAVGICIGIVKPESTCGAFSLSVGIAAIALVVNGIAAGIFSSILPLICISGVLYYMLGQMYHSLLQSQWQRLDNEPYRTPQVGTGWDVAIHDHKGLVEGIIHHAR